MTERLGGCLTASYFADLFRVDVGGGFYAFLPFLLTAMAVGVVLAAAVFTLLRAMEAKFLRRLTEAGADSAEAGKTLPEIGYAQGAFRTRWLLHLLHSPTCILYRNASSDEYDRVRAQFAAMGAGNAAAEEESGTGSVGEGTGACRAATDADGADTNGSAAVMAHATPETTETSTTHEAAGNAENPTAPHGGDAEERRARREEARRQRRLGLKIAATEETRFYIPTDRRAYVEEHAAKFSTDDVMGLLYSVAAAGLLWFILLNVLNPLLKLLTK